MFYSSDDEVNTIPPRGKKITWDEKSISEQDKERGTRTKISEVLTPFCYMSDVESQDESSNRSDSIDNNDLTNDVIARLNQIQKSYEKKREFAEHRRRHYSREFDRDKLLKSKEDTEDEEDDSSNVMTNETCETSGQAAS